MIAEIGTVLKDLGLPGIVISGLVWFVLDMRKEHKRERAEWLRTLEKHSDEMNKNMRSNTSVLAGLKALLESKNGK
jgi:hypothetical protein